MPMYEGWVHGSEFFHVVLPSGVTSDSSRINVYFRSVFREFGEAAYPHLADLLNHEREFVRVGTYAVLNGFMYSHGIRYKSLDFNPRPQKESARVEAIVQLKAVLEEARARADPAADAEQPPR